MLMTVAGPRAAARANSELRKLSRAGYGMFNEIGGIMLDGRAASAFEFELVPDDGDGSRLGVWGGVGGENLELEEGARRPANQLNDIRQGNAVGVHERVVALRQGHDAVTGVKLSTEFGGCARQQLVDDRIAILDAQGGADSDRRNAVNSVECRGLLGRVGKFVRPLQGGIGILFGPARNEGLKEFGTVSLGDLIAQCKSGGWIGTEQSDGGPL